MFDSFKRVSVRKPKRRPPSLDFSMTGLVYCCLMMFMGLAAMNIQANLLFGIFGLMIGILFISAIVSRIVVRSLTVHRNLPRHGAVGEPMTVYYEIRNLKRFWPSLSINITELDAVDGFVRPPQCYMLHVAPRSLASVPVELLPKRRGMQELDHFQMSTSFPFGFIKRTMMGRRKEMICIFPAMAEVDSRLMALCRSADHIGQASRPQSGGMDEFYGVREYRPGDNPRHIYWRRSAKTGILVSKDMTRVAPPRLVIVVDTHVSDPSIRQQQLVERVIAMAASLAFTALEQELLVGVCATSGDEIIFLPPLSGKQQLEEILTLLARLPVNQTIDGGHLLNRAAWMLAAGTTLVLFTPQDFRPKLPDHARGGIVVVSASSDSARTWFRFRPGVSFEGDDASPSRQSTAEMKEDQIPVVA